jgi:hypothetical protein
MPTTAATASPPHFVLFADILGFSALVVEHGEVLQRMHSRRHFVSDTIDVLELDAGFDNPLQIRFLAFHRIIDDVSDQMLQFHESSLLVFSDAFYMESLSLGVVVGFAGETMRQFLHSGVPVRMGIGCGSFLLNRSRVDTSAVAGVRQSLEFLGQAVVRAYQAESCGHIGMRIFLHPSTRDHLTDGRRNLRLPLESANDRAFAELNYLLPATPPIPSDPRHEKYGSDRLISAVRRMQTLAPPDKAAYYTETFAAIQRMRQQLDGDPPTALYM